MGAIAGSRVHKLGIATLLLSASAVAGTYNTNNNFVNTLYKLVKYID
jgi:hypothetical protein